MNKINTAVLEIPSQHGIIHHRPAECFSTPYRLWQGCPTVAVTPGGRLLAGWYSGGLGEPDMRNYNLLVRSDDCGRSWTEPLLVIESNVVLGMRCIDIQLWIDPANQCWLFWTQVIGWGGGPGQPGMERHETWAMTANDPDSDEIKWSEPFYVADGFLRCKPTVLQNGTWLLCSYDRSSTRYHYYESCDNGKSWTLRKAGRKVLTPFDETMILEHEDGTLRLFARTANTGFIAESVSRDGGKSWSDGEDGSIVSPGSRFYIGRLKSGNIICVRNNDSSQRRNMSVSLSRDDGKSWTEPLLLDSREETSYPDVAEDNNGNIYIIHDWNRVTDKGILLTRITEDEIIRRRICRADSYIAGLINQPPQIAAR